MPNYPRKIRARKRAGVWMFEELVPSAGGSLYVNDRVTTDTGDIFEALADPRWLPELLNVNKASEGPA